MVLYRCTVCRVFEYDSARGIPEMGITPGMHPKDFSADWHCPVCNADATHLAVRDMTLTTPGLRETPEAGEQSMGGIPIVVPRTREWKAGSAEPDWLEEYLSDIRLMATTGASVIEPMRTRKAVLSWDDILIKGAQIARIPLNSDTSVSTRTVIGPGADLPMVIDTPVFISHMSFGALSREAKIALARGSAAVGTAIGSGEGGILDDERRNAYRYIFEYVPNRYSVTEKNLRSVDAIEIKLGQSAEPGLGAHLPGGKVTPEIAQVRGYPEGTDIISPASFDDIRSEEDLTRKIEWLRSHSGGRPIGVKIAAGNIREDMKVLLRAGPDFITIDGRPGGTGAAPKYIKAATSIPTIFALHRARSILDEEKAGNISLIITGGLRVSSDFAKALSLGADAIAISTAALIACGCEQYRLCHTGTCPTGVATQKPEFRQRLQIDTAAKRVENFLRICTEELKSFARLTGNDDVHSLCIDDLCTTSSEISLHTAIRHV
jgi:glutamate synthase domain-containing protein 2/rubredoxin